MACTELGKRYLNNKNENRTMKITDHIKNADGKTLFSFEIVPPQKGVGIADLYKNIDPLMELSM